MAVTLDAATKVFTVPQADLTLVTGTFYRMDTETYFRAQVNALMDDWNYICMDDPIRHNTEVTVAGVTYARFIEMINGYSVTFTPDSAWTVELTGSNNNLWDVGGGVLNQNGVQVVPTNSAGLIGSKQIQDQTYEDARVWIDPNTGVSGTAFPIGTPGSPVDNLTDAEAIIANRGLPKRLHLRGNLTLTGADDIDSYDIVGVDTELSSIDLGGASTASVHFEKVNVTGAASGDMHLTDCKVGGVTNFTGSVERCGITGNITLGDPTGPNDFDFIDCRSRVPGTSTPVIDCNSLNNLQISIRGWIGGIEIRNYDSAANDMSIDMAPGHAILHASCTNGTIVVRGPGHVTDNSAGTTIVTTGLVAGDELTHLWQDRGFDADNTMVVDETAGTISVAGTIRTWTGTLIKTLTRTT